MLMQTEGGPRIRFASSEAAHRLVISGLLAAIALVTFGGSLLNLVHRWQTQEEYSYGYLIPVIVGWLLWTRRRAIVASVGQPSWIGPSLILVAALMHVVGRLSALFFLSQLGFILVLFGIALGVGGYSLLRVVFVPLLYLIFAIPMPYFIEASLSWRLQVVSSQLGVFFIRLSQIPVFLQGNVIDLGNYKLQVVDACSGLRYLYPLLSLSFLAAYLFQTSMRQRVLVFLSAIPITILMNSLRIGLVGITVDTFGPQAANHALHMFEGWVIFLACAGVLVAEMGILARFASGKSFFELFYAPVIAGAGSSRRDSSRFVRWAPLATCLVLLGATGLAGFVVSTRQEIYPQRRTFATFPTTLGQWKGEPSSLGPDVRRVLGFSDYIISDYARPNGHPVNLYVAYYASQRSGVSPHSPSVCIPGNGWRITEFERTHYRLNHVSIPINRAIITRNSDKELVYYWYDERGRNIANEYWSKLLLLHDAILKNRTDGALIRFITAIYPGESVHDAERRLHAFMAVAVPTLAQYLPTKSGKLARVEAPLKSAKR